MFQCCEIAYFRYDSNVVLIEEGIPNNTIEQLRTYGHNITGPVSGYERSSFGKGQVISRGILSNFDQGSKVYWVGTDPRSDGIAIGY